MITFGVEMRMRSRIPGGEEIKRDLNLWKRETLKRKARRSSVEKEILKMEAILETLPLL